MQEIFKNQNTDTLIFDDKGITYHDSKKHVSKDVNSLNNAFFPYGSLKDVTINGLFRMVYLHYKIDGEVRILVFVYDKADKARIKDSIELARKEIIKSIPAEVINLDKAIEHRMYCNVCKKVFCFSEDDVRKNKINAQLAKSANSRAITETIIGNRMIAEAVSKDGDNYQDKIVDFDKCPNCGSSNIRELNEDEFKKIQEANTNSLSSADELKKFKELLDMGVLTQEEFDAKKKQLLGL